METNFRKKGALRSASFMGDLAIKHGKKYSQSSRKQPPWKFAKVVVTRARHLRELALVSDRMVKKEDGRLRAVLKVISDS